MNKHLVVAAVLGGLMIVTSPVVAADDAKTPQDHVVTSANTKKESQRLLKLSNEGFAGMRAVRAARISIFNGKVKRAKEMIATAQKQLRMAAKDAKAFLGPSSKSGSKVKENEIYIPIDASLGLGEDFVMTDAKKEHIGKANEYFKKGDHANAIEALKLAEIDVSYTRIMLPVQKAIARLDAAASQWEASKFYEANLTLKAIEDSQFIDTVMLIDVPTASKEEKEKKKEAKKKEK